MPPGAAACYESNDLVIVGRVRGACGLAGQVRVVSETQPRSNIEHYRPWLLDDGCGFRAVDVTSLRPQGDGYVAGLAGVGDRTQAEALRGRDIAVPASALPLLESEREYYWRDLIGLAVQDQSGRVLGTVTRLLETGAHDVLVVSDGARETLIPFVEVFVREVDGAAARIRVDWPDQD